MPDRPLKLDRVEFCRIYFALEMQEGCRLGPTAVLQLRRELRLLSKSGFPGARGLETALSPPLSSDPVALRLHQRPGHAFVFHPPVGLPACFEPGDCLELPALFLGQGIQQIPLLARALEGLGPRGISRSEGSFELSGISAESPSGERVPLWKKGGKGRCFDGLAPPIIDAQWWLDRRFFTGSDVELIFTTPARLISGGRPLFRPGFRDIFPFILRRVSSMVSFHCDLDVSDDSRRLPDLAGQVEEHDNRLHWVDWRTLQRREAAQELGGIVGRVLLSGEALRSLYWALVLGALFNIGKGAGFGAGHFELRHIPTRHV